MFNKYCSDDQTEKNDMGGACSTNGWGNLRGRDHLKEGRIILRRIFRKYDGGPWTELIWLRIETNGEALVNAVMNLRVP